MIKYCVDTNAILDLCYRYYPPLTFNSVWGQMEGCILSRQISLIISEHIHTEVMQQIALMGYDKSIFTDFMNRFKVVVIPKKDYELELAKLQAELLEVTPLSSSINKNAGDLSNICVAQIKSATIITAEQGSKLEITDKMYKRLKIPDTCRYYKIPCHNWLPLFEHIGYR